MNVERCQHPPTVGPFIIVVWRPSLLHLSIYLSLLPARYELARRRERERQRERAKERKWVYIYTVARALPFTDQRQRSIMRPRVASRLPRFLPISRAQLAQGYNELVGTSRLFRRRRHRPFLSIFSGGLFFCPLTFFSIQELKIKKFSIQSPSVGWPCPIEVAG